MLLALCAASWLLLSGPAEAEASTEAQAAGGTGPVPQRLARPGAGEAEGGVPDVREAEARRRERRVWEARLERAQLTLERYRATTRYPFDSRPMREHPDRVHPAAPERELPLDSRDEDNPVRLKLRQSAVFAAGEQTVDFSVGCEGPQGERLPCEVVQAVAREAPHLEGAEKLAPVPLTFADAGQPGDAAANDGTWSVRFQPAREGFTLFSGTLRVEVQVRSGQSQGSAFFDFMYTASPPAAFTGRVRESVEAGSLQLDVELQVRTAGRYVVEGRVDDARGQPYAHLTFNEELPEGRQQVRFTLFGRLLHDEPPAFPLTLRDVEGFLLKEQGEPDRELLVPLLGRVHTTRSYSLAAFSEAEWQSEEKTRYLTEYGKDVSEAKAQLEALSESP